MKCYDCGHPAHGSNRCAECSCPNTDLYEYECDRCGGDATSLRETDDGWVCDDCSPPTVVELPEPAIEPAIEPSVERRDRVERVAAAAYEARYPKLKWATARYPEDWIRVAHAVLAAVVEPT